MNQYVYLELIDKAKNTEKFYELDLDLEQQQLCIRYGRIGQIGQEQIFSDESDVLIQLFLKKKNEKLKKGYVEVAQEDRDDSDVENHELHLIIKSNLETIIQSFSMHIKKEHQQNVALLADLLESDEFNDEGEELEERVTALFAEFLYQTSSNHFSVDWKDVEAMQAHLEETDDKFSVFLPQNFIFVWNELPQDEDEHSIPMVLNVARQQLLAYGLDILIFDDGYDVYRGWITAVKYVNPILIAAENINLNLSVPDDEWLEIHE